MVTQFLAQEYNGDYNGDPTQSFDVTAHVGAYGFSVALVLFAVLCIAFASIRVFRAGSIESSFKGTGRTLMLGVSAGAVILLIAGLAAPRFTQDSDQFRAWAYDRYGVSLSEDISLSDAASLWGRDGDKSFPFYGPMMSPDDATTDIVGHVEDGELTLWEVDESGEPTEERRIRTELRDIDAEGGGWLNGSPEDEELVY